MLIADWRTPIDNCESSIRLFCNLQSAIATIGVSQFLRGGRRRRRSVPAPSPRRNGTPWRIYACFALALQLHRADGVHSRSHGFTLIEVTIATALLVTIALGTAQLFALALGHTISSRHQVLMTAAAERKLDELTVAAARGIVAFAPPGTLDLDIDGFVDRPADAGGAYVRRWRVTPVLGYETEALAIVVRVLPPARTADVVVTAIVSRGPW